MKKWIAALLLAATSCGGGGKNAAPIGVQILQEYLGPRYAAQQQAAATAVTPGDAPRAVRAGSGGR